MKIFEIPSQRIVENSMKTKKKLNTITIELLLFSDDVWCHNQGEELKEFNKCYIDVLQRIHSFRDKQRKA